MTDPNPEITRTTVGDGGHAATSAAAAAPIARTIMVPLWVAAISLATIAVVLLIGSVQIVHALHTAQASVVQLQEQVQQLKQSLGGLMGG